MQFLQDNWMLVAVAVASGVMLAYSFVSAKLSGVQQADTLTATRLYNDDALVLDVREDKEWAEGHIPRARHIPLGKLSERLAELEKFKDKPVLVNCRSGMRSASACKALRRAGFEHVYNLAGGILAWEKASLPLTKK